MLLQNRLKTESIMLQNFGSTPLVSIVLPTYNRAACVGEALQSCLQQTYRNLEVIVVDDGSSDETSQVVADFQRRDSRVRYVSQENQGLPAALNAGFRVSQGAYLTWTSDDNRYHCDAIEIMLRALMEHPAWHFVYCDYELVDEKGRFLRRIQLPDPAYLAECNCIGACFMYRRQVGVAVGDYNRDFVLVEDYEYWLRVNQQFTIVHLSDVSPYSYCEHVQSLTARRMDEIQIAKVRVRLRYAATWRSKVDIFLRTRLVVAHAYLNLGHWQEAASAALAQLLYQPWRRSCWLIILACLSGTVRGRKLLDRALVAGENSKL